MCSGWGTFFSILGITLRLADTHIIRKPDVQAYIHCRHFSSIFFYHLSRCCDMWRTTAAARHPVSKLSLQTACYITPPLKHIHIEVSGDFPSEIHTHMGWPSDEISFCHLACCVTRCISPAKASAANPALSLSGVSLKATHTAEEPHTLGDGKSMAPTL